ncbi:hypothetical protein JHK87_004626 [Glycine soja]|nr:hypothetical protein JHK87_004626 [Glycine soja]
MRKSVKEVVILGSRMVSRTQQPQQNPKSIGPKGTQASQPTLRTMSVLSERGIKEYQLRIHHLCGRQSEAYPHLHSVTPHSYAFINGIEVYSMSSNLYYTLQNDTGFKLVGRDTFFALETEYRIKVGGQEILP